MNKFFKKLKDEFLATNNIVLKKYKTIKKIGFGAYGNVYSAMRIKDKSIFAMKTEKVSALKKTLESEAYYLYNLQGGFGIPKFISYGHSKNYYILIETLLDKTLYNIFIENSRKCEVTDACLIGHQVLDRLEWVHSKDLIYRDMKPSNFLIGKKDPNVIYITDFGLCKKYRSSKTGKHLLPRKTGQFNGTLKYASSYVIKGKEPTRRDDLIALGYILIYFLKKELPWQEKCEIINKSNYMELIHLKETDGNGKLFQNIPEEIVEYMKYTKNLKFEQNPDYSYLHSLFNKLLSKKTPNYRKLTFSWIDPKNKYLLGMPKSSSRRKSSHHKRLFNSIQEKISRRFSDKILNLNNSKNDNYNIKAINTNNNLKDEPNSHIIQFDIKKELNENKSNYNINKYIITNDLTNFNDNIKNESYNNKITYKNVANINKNILNRNLSISMKKCKLNLEFNKNNNKDKILLTNFNRNNKKISNSYKCLTNLNITDNKNNKNVFINNDHTDMKKYMKNKNNNLIPINNIKSIKNRNKKNILKKNNIQNKKVLKLSTNIEYISPLLKRNMKINNNHENIPKTKRFNLIIGDNNANSNEYIFSRNNIKKNKLNKDVNIIYINNNIKLSNNEKYFSSCILNDGI